MDNGTLATDRTPNIDMPDIRAQSVAPVINITKGRDGWITAKTQGASVCGAYSCLQLIHAWALVDGPGGKKVPGAQPILVAMMSGMSSTVYFPWGSTRMLNDEEFFAKYTTELHGEESEHP